MKLQEFVSETLIQIVGGVGDAVKAIQGDETTMIAGAGGERGAKINPPLSTSAETLEKKGYRIDTSNRPVQNVEFDVAVMVDEKTEVKGTAKGKAGLLVAAIGLDVEGGVERKDATVHRIKFAVPVVLPLGKE